MSVRGTGARPGRCGMTRPLGKSGNLSARQGSQALLIVAVDVGGETPVEW